MEKLTEAVGNLQAEVGRLRRSFDRRTRIAVVIAVVIATALASAVVIQANNDRRIRESDQRWCPIMALLVPQSGDPPPTTARAKLFAQRATDLAREFDCPTGA